MNIIKNSFLSLFNIKKKILYFIICLIIFKQISFANDMSAILYIFTTYLPTIFIVFLTLLVVSITIISYQRKVNLQKIITPLIYLCYLISILSFLATVFIDINPFKSGVWYSVLLSLTIIAASNFLIYHAHKQIKSPSEENFSFLKTIITLYIFFLISSLIILFLFQP